MNSQQDPYPSRSEGLPPRLPRVDPVLHQGGTIGPLAPEQCADYERDGYLTLGDLFAPEEIARMAGELDRLRADERVRQSEIGVTEPMSGEIRSIFAVQTVSDPFHRLAADERVLGVVRQLLGSEVYLHQARVNFKPGFRGKEFYWHSDFETWHCEDGMPRMRAVSCSIALTPNLEYNGPLMVMPGSHRYFFPCEGRTPDDHYLQSLKKQDYGVPSDEQLAWMAEEFGIDVPKGPAGTVTFFDCNLMHGSNGNITPFPRSNGFFVYNSVENALQEPFAAPQQRPWFLANRDATPLQPLRFSEHPEEALAAGAAS